MSIQSIEAEQSVLGSIMLEDDLLKECRLTEEHFTSAVHQAIFRMMKQMEEEGGPVDLVTLSEKMGPSFLEQIGGISFLVSMIESVPTTANFFHYEKMVRSAWKMRKAARIAHHMYEQLHSLKDEKIIGSGITKLSELEEDGCTEEVEFSDAIIQVFESFQEDIGELSGIDTGFYMKILGISLKKQNIHENLCDKFL
ncbi:DnaB-like helicase N-terminal domain-containing protein [Ectobacillus sp. sgz5001026]|uniref:DnaB-like helicase N-terminal domain-containing protein n=1 Tax=Ectobacillus sp. sgz5001026 TaxID=3242473 RepID=UPI0036D31779